jgi:intracellular sulfur oxidation DsrE/DsrF family protein
MKGPLPEMSEHTLNALADRQFAPEEQGELLRALDADPQAAARLFELRNLKESVQMAYSEVPPLPIRGRRGLFRHHPLAMAAGLLLAVLIGAAVGTREFVTQTPGERFAILDPRGTAQGPATPENQEMRVVFHVQSVERLSAAEVLDEVEGLLQDFRLNHHQVRVEVVAHGRGLDLLRTDLTNQGQRIARMARDYPQLAFVACLNTIERLKNEQGIEVELLPQARTTLSGVAHVVRLQKEGWYYIQV